MSIYAFRHISPIHTFDDVEAAQFAIAEDEFNAHVAETAQFIYEYFSHQSLSNPKATLVGENQEERTDDESA